MREELDLLEGTARRTSTLVGRDYQLMAVEEVLDQVSVQVVGMPGTGVSALLDTVADRRLDAGVPVLRVPASPWSAVPTSPLDDLDALLPHVQGPLVVVDDAQLFPLDRLSALVSAVEDREGRVLLGVHPGELLDLDVVHLPGLSRDAVRVLLTEALGRPLGFADECLVVGLARSTRGHVSHLLALLESPLLDELAAVAAQRQDLDAMRDDFADALADSTREKLSVLDESERLAIAVTALAGPHAPGALVDGAAGTGQLARGRVVGLLERDGDSHRFRHAAVRDLVRRGTPRDVLAEARWRISVAAQAAGLHHAPVGVY